MSPPRALRAFRLLLPVWHLSGLSLSEDVPAVWSLLAPFHWASLRWEDWPWAASRLAGSRLGSSRLRVWPSAGTRRAAARSATGFSAGLPLERTPTLETAWLTAITKQRAARRRNFSD